MTGNTSKWRAPLAGLASVAMLATMGVAASTANAAVGDVPEVNLHIDTTYTNAKGFGADKDGVKVVKDATNDNNLKTELYGASTMAEMNNVNSKWVFTGWYTSPNAGEAYDPAAELSTSAPKDLYAHYAQLDQAVQVKLPTSSETSFAEGYYESNGNAFYLNRADSVAAWQTATADKNKGNHKLFSAYQADTDGDGNYEDVTLSGKTGDALADLISPEPAGTAVLSLRENLDTNAKVVEYKISSQNTAKGWKLNGDAKVDVHVKGTAPQQSASKDGGYTASAWTNEDTKKAWDFSDPVKTDTTLWLDITGAAATYTVTYEVQTSGAAFGALKNDSYTVQAPAGEALPSHEVPAAKEGYKFLGWTTDSSLTSGSFVKDVKLFNGTVDKDLTVYAVYAPEYVEVTYNLGYPTANKTYTTQKYAEGDTFKAPSDPTRDGGYEFLNWTPSIKWQNFTVNLTLDGQIWSQGSAPQQIPTTYTANWVLGTKESLADYENKIPENYLKKDAANYKNGDDESQPYFTAASFDQYVKDWQTYKKDKAAKGTLSRDEIVALIKELSGFQSKLVETGTAPLYRAYNKNNGDHYYTKSKAEYEALVKLGWTAEGNKFNAVKTRVANTGTYAGDPKAVPANLGESVYSVYNPNTGEHLLTTKGEAQSLAKVGWNNEGVKFYTPQNGSEAVYRIYNPNTNGPAHAYVGKDEGTKVVAKGWKWDNNANAVYHFTK
ncbi:InlB B-repeat-containing protein [Bifidobacterium sp. MA2]|uniref:InlB B-repeat-containing protein n=1 Tax=Bifidobacterium santillanense TaxID=2809028 RepID=A0ABS5UP31_9BIFI|nr:InlB B-repeat-containing protein [Bifidobacterium santillanense]MBT1172698.1 InlB B-repeat-containing protein [Bifidobacterium santillanense]